MILLGYSKAIYDILHHGQTDLNKKIKAIYVDPELKKSETWEGYPLITSLDEVKNYTYLCGLWDTTANKRLSTMAENLGMKITEDVFIVRSGIQSISKFCEIGAGSVICDNVSIYSGVKIGKSSMIAFNQLFAHNCNIGDFNVFLGQYSSIGADTSCGDYNIFGAGCHIRNKVKIGNSCAISIGAVVTKNMADNTIAIGNPAKIKKRRVWSNFKIWK